MTSSTLLARLGTFFSGLLVSIAVAVGLTRGVGLATPPKRPASRFRPSLPGLTEQEAASRRTDFFAQERTQLQKKRRKQIIRTAVFSVFNLTMLVLAFSQFWLDDFWGAMGTLCVLAFNILLIVFQQGFAQRQVSLLLDSLATSAPPSSVRAASAASTWKKWSSVTCWRQGKGMKSWRKVSFSETNAWNSRRRAEKKTCIVRPGELSHPGQRSTCRRSSV